MISTVENKLGYNPIQDHIKMSFIRLDDYGNAAQSIVQDLKHNGFDPSLSKVLVFSQSRRRAEVETIRINDELDTAIPECSNKVAFYHAGLDGNEREERYEDFKKDKLSILVATKAFGMGMDIKNIHYVYHLSPSSSFEDFLQEIGRAGRDQKMLQEANFSVEQPIIAKCFISNDSFKSIKDRLHSLQITWSQIIAVRQAIFNYVSRFQGISENSTQPFALPLDLIEHDSQFEEVVDKQTFFRISLYWLEKLNRIQLGVYVPTHLPIQVLDDPDYTQLKKPIDRNLIEVLWKAIKAEKKSRFPNQNSIMVSMTFLRNCLEVNSFRDVFRVLFLAQRCKCLVVEREVDLKPTKSKTQELLDLNRWLKLPILEAVFELAHQLIDATTPNDEVEIDGDFLDQLVQAVKENAITTDVIYWKSDDVEKLKELKHQEQEFVEKRSKFSFKLISFLDKLKYSSKVELNDDSLKATTSQRIFNGNRKKKQSHDELTKFQQDLLSLIIFIKNNFFDKDQSRFNIVGIINHLGIEEKGEDYLNNLIFISKGLGYLKGQGNLVPMGIELYFKQLDDILEQAMPESDKSIRNEFQESNQMKELRLLALECLAKMPMERHDAFIKNYFNCSKPQEVVSLLEEYFGEENESLKAYRSIALNKEKEKLNDDQKAVYDAPITKNLQVIAGPGTGKTHTLIIRIARLIQEEKVNPDNILVLAYNRAVVVELKARLTKLFNELGYSKLIKRLKVFTFHGFCKYCLRDQLDHKPFSEWTAEFLRLTKNRPGHISQILGNIKYVFVDEFQDITNERLELLKYVANPKRTNICVIGDPNQSIYGYERSNLGDTMDPVFYYEKYQEIYAPNTFALTVNYRSFSEIIKQSELLLAQNSTVFDMPKMQAKVSDHDENDIVEIIDYDKNRVKWQDKLVELVHHKRQDGGKYRQIALMFRSNEEVFKAFNDVADIQFDDVRIRIQGSNQSLYKSREFFHLNNYLIENPRLILSANFFQEISKRANALLNTHQNWSEYIIHLYLCIVLEFEKEAEAESTNQELLDFIFDLSAKDDGQLGKLYQQNIPRVNPGKRETEIVLTTMHKVKGMEYDAVMIPASFSNFPHSSVSQGLEIADLIEEERRLYYVAYSRAKYKLVVIKWKREKAIEQGVSCSLMTEDERRERLGISFKDGIDKLKLYWGASNYGQESFIWILDNVKIGDPVVLAKEIIAGYSFWHVMHNGIKIGQLSAMASGRLDGCSRVHGYSISAMSVHTYEETINSPTGADFAKNWTAESKDRGYIYLVDFSGYGKESQIN